MGDRNDVEDGAREDLADEPEKTSEEFPARSRGGSQEKKVGGGGKVFARWR
jgi:hypothetical protein